MELSEHLFSCLKKADVDCTFGIPGDFALPLYAAQAKAGLRTVVCTHEPGAAFAADAYARLRGLGVAVTTYGAGALNMVNPVAMSFAEHSPLLVISGAPDTHRRGPDVHVHHMVKRFDSQERIFDEITAASAVIDNPRTAADEIERVVNVVMQQKRPGYLEIPRDLTRTEIDKPKNANQPEDAGTTDKGALDEAVGEILEQLQASKRPVLYAGVGVRRYGLMQEAVRLAETWSLPLVTSVMGKASVPESHPNFVGVYMGALGNPAAREAVEKSDCVLSLGVIFSDVNTGFWTAKIDTENLIRIGKNRTQVRHHHFEPIGFKDVVLELAEARSDSPSPALTASAPPSPDSSDPRSPLKTIQIIDFLRGLDQSKFSFVADVGDAWFMGLEMRADIFMAPGYYATMGFAVPGALGAGIADNSRRPFVLVGDGAFQMTGTELATMRKEGLAPIVLLSNNASYTMLEALDTPHDYYGLDGWDYVAFAKSLRCDGERVKTRRELTAAYGRARQSEKPYVIEAIIDKNDISPFMRRIQNHFAKVKKQANQRQP